LDHFLEPGPGDPLLAHVLLFVLPVRWSRLEAGGQEEVAALAAEALRAVQEPELDQAAGAQAGLLAELQPGEFGRAAGLPRWPATLREGPDAPPDRVPVLLDQVEAVVLSRDDEREVGLLHERVGAARAVPPLDLVAAQPHPAVLVDHITAELADVRRGWLPVPLH
jgi:hypothetical protein